VTDCDELTDLIMDVFDAHDEGHHSTALDAAQRILSRWRLVPVEEPKHERIIQCIGNGPVQDICKLCGQDWPCDSVLCGEVNPDTGGVCVLGRGHARHHLTATQRDEIRQRREQHRAADELTHHDQAAAHYDDSKDEQ
jgi:hypothetical protein